MDLTASPETIAAGVAIAVSTVAMVRKWWMSPAVVSDGGSVPSVVPAVAAGPLLPVAPAVPGGPPVVPPAPGPLPLAVAPVAAAVNPVTYLMALGCFRRLMANTLNQVIVNMITPTITNLGTRIRSPRLVWGHGLSHPTAWFTVGMQKFNLMRASAVKLGNRERTDANWSLLTAVPKIVTRMQTKIFEIIPFGTRDTRYRRANQGFDVHMAARYTFRSFLVERSTSGDTYPVYEFGEIRSDVGWTIVYFLIVKHLLEDNGATTVQANYIACAMVIELVGVSYGIHGNTDFGVDPTDFGFEVPVTLPTY